MLIGIIGAGISGLTAGRILAKAGHEVVVFEKSRGYGGRICTRYSNKYEGVRFDHGAPYISGDDPLFLEFIQELTEKGVARKWTDTFHFHDGEKMYDKHPNMPPKSRYVCEDGMNAIGKYLSRWVDVRLNSRVIGFTYQGDRRTTKRAWMLNLENFDTFEVDAIVVAAPAVQAYGLIENSIDETMFKTIIKDIDSVLYSPKHALMLAYEDAPAPDFAGLVVSNNPVISWICNENSKRNTDGKVALTVHTQSDFSKKHVFDGTAPEIIELEIAQQLRKVLGDWAGRYDESQMRLWRYPQPGNYFDKDFVELGGDIKPIALTGDYMRGKTLEHAFVSGYKLGHHWANRFSK
ncbi:MAG: FAD-dependent oxidoreductase [Candidatus Cyclonatronum sp.]|uniref:NAD(P)/FAD-dependent oxidoreductase n=1 Tax=Cyclonatronum sp. TaxID=3024185 RepID=UPI0025C710CD|nr:FAD-dependent oxidoreductase [Cyclonatronum sp.]MCC5933151.1 FAD-dependent oxidoreductase [Balneolales bacterium]MCH8485539.1 FAD-dependent oxidoreductase [Cyclonatronum sp.]